jgi:hypothetical protein
MIKNRKTVNILLIAILLLTINLLLIFNGCSNSDSTDTVTEENQNILSNESDVSAESSDESSVGENVAEETSVSENENGEDASNSTGGKEDNSSNESSNSLEEKDNSLKSIYQRFAESGKPSILVFSYDADCCASTKAFFDEYNSKAKKVLEENKDKFNTLFINTGILDKENTNTAIEIAAQNEVLNLPSILLLDKACKSYKVIEGVFNEAEVKKVLGGMLND